MKEEQSRFDFVGINTLIHIIRIVFLVALFLIGHIHYASLGSIDLINLSRYYLILAIIDGLLLPILISSWNRGRFILEIECWTTIFLLQVIVLPAEPVVLFAVRILIIIMSVLQAFIILADIFRGKSH